MSKTGFVGRPLRVVVVSPLAVRYDAISLAAYDTARAFAADPRFDVTHLGCACDYPDIRHRGCGNAADLLLAPEYQAADVAIFGFGIHHGLFDALMAGGPRTRIVRFHNVTPARFVAPADRPVIERSLRQIHNLRRADEIWADSVCNAEELLALDFDPARIRIIPLAVEHPSPATLVGKPSSPVRVLFIGRIVPSKGIHDLLAAVALAGLRPDMLHVTIAGNTAWSDPAYIAQLRRLIATNGLDAMVHFEGMVDDPARERLFHAAHVLAIPSYHEGFCRPVVEGLRAGCIPLAYDAYNLPHVVSGLGRLVPTGDVGALAAALSELCQTVPRALAAPDAAFLPLDIGDTATRDFDERARAHVAGFRFDQVSFAMRQRLLRLARVNGAARC